MEETKYGSLLHVLLFYVHILTKATRNLLVIVYDYGSAFGNFLWLDDEYIGLHVLPL